MINTQLDYNITKSVFIYLTEHKQNLTKNMLNAKFECFYAFYHITVLVSYI